MNKKRLTLNLVGQIITFFCNILISFLLTPYIVKHLGQETYGFVGLANNVTSYITLFTVAINGMLSRYITVEYSRKEYKNAAGYLSTAIFAQLILAVVLIVPMMLFAWNMDDFFNVSSEILLDVRILWVLIFLSFLIGLPTSGLVSATFAKNRLDIQAVINVISQIIRSAILLITFVFFTPHVWYIGLATILSNIVSILLNAYSKHKYMPEVKISIKQFNPKYIHKLLVVGIWNSLNKLQQILYSGLDLLITNLFINGSEMGLLSIAKTIPNQISTLISTVSSTFDPTMTITYGNGNMKEFLYQTKFAMKFNGFICSVPILGFVAFGMDFYSLWMPSLSEADLLKVHILAILTLLPQVFSVYIYPLYTVNTITTKLKVPVLVSIVIGIVNVSIVLLLLNVTSLGVYAVAGVSSILWVLRIFLFVPTYAAWSLKVKLNVFYIPLLKGCLNVFIVGGLFCILSYLINIDSWSAFIITCLVVGTAGYLLCFFILFNKKEKNKVISKIKKKIRKGSADN